MRTYNTVPNGKIMQQIGHSYDTGYYVIDGIVYNNDLDYRNYYGFDYGFKLYDWKNNVPFSQRESVYELNPNQVILNGIPGGAAENAKRFNLMEKNFSAIGIYHYCIVIDGINEEDFIRMAFLARDIPGVYSFAIRAETAKRLAHGDRPALIRAIASLNMDIHLLDHLDTMSDMCDKWLHTHPRVIGLSGQRLIDLGYSNIIVPYAPTFPSVNAYVDWSNVDKLTTTQLESIRTNIINWSRSTPQ